MEIKINAEDGYGHGGFVGYLPADLTVTEINKALGFRAQFTKGQLDKVDRQWVFNVDGAHGRIYRHKGESWNFGGEPAAFKLFVASMGWTLEGKRASR